MLALISAAARSVDLSTAAQLNGSWPHYGRWFGSQSYGMPAGSLWLDARELDHLGPLLGFVSDELSEFGRRHRHRHAPEVGKPRLKLGVGEDGIDLSVELLDDLSGRVFWHANPVPRTRLVTRHEIVHGRDVG